MLPDNLDGFGNRLVVVVCIRVGVPGVRNNSLLPRIDTDCYSHRYNVADLGLVVAEHFDFHHANLVFHLVFLCWFSTSINSNV